MVKRSSRNITSSIDELEISRSNSPCFREQDLNFLFFLKESNYFAKFHPLLEFPLDISKERTFRLIAALLHINQQISWQLQLQRLGQSSKLQTLWNGAVCFQFVAVIMVSSSKKSYEAMEGRECAQEFGASMKTNLRAQGYSSFWFWLTFGSRKKTILYMILNQNQTLFQRFGFFKCTKVQKIGASCDD